MKKIAIDITALSDQYKNRGIGTYAFNIIRKLIQNKHFEWHLIGFDDVKERFKNNDIYFHSLGQVRASTPQNLLLFSTKYVYIIKQIEADLYFAPHFERGLPLGICKTVVTVHDVSPYLFNKYSSKGSIVNFLKGFFYKYNLRRAKRADLIFTGSNFIKGELIKVGFDKEKINVAYLGLSESFDVSVLKKVGNRDKILQKYGIRRPYLLYYGGLEPNKNVYKLIKAFAVVRQKNDRIKLVLTDKALYREKEELIAESIDALKVKKLIKKLGVADDLILPKFIDWKDLPIVHAEAQAFIHLSSYEGFGLACIEAMAAGCPVIAADRSCYPEVLGDAALLVDPDNIEIVARNILEVVSDEKLRGELSLKGKRQANKYSWEKCASETLKVFKKLL